MFGHRFFGARFYGPRYFGPSADGGGGGSPAVNDDWIIRFRRRGRR